jgi:ABC-type dipeptide/oligopeptide/nickel transport system permease component
MTVRYIIKRIVLSMISLLGGSVIGFVLFRIMPGDPALLMVGIGASEADIERMRIMIGENLPIYQQYIIWLRDVITGNLGTSLFYHEAVPDVILSKLPATLELIISALFLATVLGVVMGAISAVRGSMWYSKFLQSLSYMFLGIPDFVWGLIFVLVFGVFFRLLPISGRIDPFISVHAITGFFILDSVLTGNLPAFYSSTTHIILPALALALPLTAIIQKTMYSSMSSILNEDYILADRAKGLSERYIIFVRAMKNSLIPTVSILGVQTTFLIGGTVLIEIIFGWPGLGSLISTAIQYKDLPLLQGIVMTYALIVILINSCADIIYSTLNPKIRFGGAESTF